MRPLVVGLIGAVLAVGSAQAGECAIDAPLVSTSRAQWPSDLKRPDLVGKIFQVEKVASRREGKTLSMAVEIASNDARFVVVRTVTMPLDHTESYDAESAPMGSLRWGKRDPKVEASEGMGPGFVLDTGPLAHIALEPQC